MRRCLSDEAITYVGFTATRAACKIKRSVNHVLRPGLWQQWRLPKWKLDEKASPQSGTWQNIEPKMTTLGFPQELPPSFATQIILANDVPALLLDKPLFRELKGFAEDFRELQRFEKLFQHDIGSFNKEIKGFERDLDDMRARRDEMRFVLDDQRARMGSADYPGPIYREHDLELLEKKIKTLEERKEKRWEDSTDCMDQMLRLRADFIAMEFKLSDMLCAIFEHVGLLDSAREQWIADRRALKTLPIRNMLWRAVDENLPATAQQYLREEFRDTRTDARVSVEGAGAAKTRLRDEVKDAFDGYEMCHWNRRIVREEYDHQRDLAEDAQKHVSKSWRLDDDAW